ncbi:MAG: hypothetical protein QXV86_02680 [Candidatus Caldarchaeum sp.]
MKKKVVQVCPACKGTSIDLHLGGYLGKVYRCGICGYVGSLIIEMEVDEYLAMMKEEKGQ